MGWSVFELARAVLHLDDWLCIGTLFSVSLERTLLIAS